jgi:hypothetical protein
MGNRHQGRRRPMPSRWLIPLPKQHCHFTMLREMLHLIFGEEQLTVHPNIEDSIASSNQGRLDAEVFSQFSSQTGRIGFVVSLGAVMDFNLHFHRLSVITSSEPLATQFDGVRSFLPDVNERYRHRYPLAYSLAIPHLVSDP